MFVEHKEQGEPSREPQVKPLDDTSDLLLKAAEWIECHGWTRGAMQKYEKTCTLGALTMASDARGDTTYGPISAAERRLKAALPEPYCSDQHREHLCAVAAWNDAPGRTKEEVVAKLRAVALGGE